VEEIETFSSFRCNTQLIQNLKKRIDSDDGSGCLCRVKQRDCIVSDLDLSEGTVTIPPFCRQLWDCVTGSLVTIHQILVMVCRAERQSYDAAVSRDLLAFGRWC
jgi:hypothetical protein